MPLPERFERDPLRLRRLGALLRQIRQQNFEEMRGARLPGGLPRPARILWIRRDLLVPRRRFQLLRRRKLSNNPRRPWIVQNPPIPLVGAPPPGRLRLRPPDPLPERYHLSARLPPVDSVSVHQILSPKYPSYVDYGNLLEDYFDRSRIISDGDTFSIPVDQFGVDPNSRIYYKIKLADNADGSFETTPRTIFYQLTSAASRIPARQVPSSIKLADNADGSFETTPRTIFYQLTSAAFRIPARQVPSSVALPSALLGVSSRIVRLVSGYLRTDVDSRLCLLLSGPGGSGKKLATAKAAELLGFNLMEVSCYELWSEVSGNSEAKITNFFRNAAKLAPCICVFKDLSVLGFDQNSSEIGRVLRCVRPSEA
uniref:ATPase_AAA_core domain-containing protein n=1 Tax=Steinernema glaseri TaxID=37863 RepID=A0A1I7ZHX2_9BILA